MGRLGLAAALRAALATGRLGLARLAAAAFFIGVFAAGLAAGLVAGLALAASFAPTFDPPCESAAVFLPMAFSEAGALAAASAALPFAGVPFSLLPFCAATMSAARGASFVFLLGCASSGGAPGSTFLPCTRMRCWS